MTDLTYISLGAGVQSTALLIISATAQYNCPKADVAIFADTQDEPNWVYENLGRLSQWSPIPILQVTRGQLSQDLKRHCSAPNSPRFDSIPAFTRGSDGKAAPGRRECTGYYKVDIISQKVRQLLGYSRRQRIKKTVEALIGISYDEAHRIKPSRYKWVTNRFPLVDHVLRRSDCIRIIRNAGLPIPKKSACVFCPYHDNAYWADLKHNYPKEFEKAIAVDELIRNAPRWKNQIYLHRSLKPLKEIEFKKTEPDTQIEIGFGNECEGMCGV